MLEGLAAKNALAKLPLADGANFDSFSDQLDARCHAGTRIDLRESIRNWANNPNGECIFWLKGMAGTGKSTISRTIAQEFKDEGRLGASFFFKRGEGDRGNASKFFSTVVAQLMSYLPSIAPHVSNVLDDDATIANQNMKEQFEKLFLQPLIEVESKISQAILIVIDALDECDHDGHINLILRLLERLHTVRHIRIFITSRPELPIRLGFLEMPEKAHRDIALHDIPTTIVKDDIIVYLTSELEQIRRRDQDQAGLSQDWPGTDNIQTLATMAIPLFIFAATICRFIGDDRWNPEAQLEAVLKYRDAGQENQLDRTYRPVLDRLLQGLTDSQKHLFVKEFQLIIGSIIILENPLSSGSLATLLNISKRNVDRKLGLLHSVLDVPSNPDLPVRLLHLSFRDFLLGIKRQGEMELLINEEQAHQQLATCCLRLLLRTVCLKQDICDLNHPGMLRQDIDSHVIARSLPPEVQYACQYWAYHLKAGRCSLSIGDEVHQLLESRLLYWLEALGLLRRCSETISMIAILKSLEMGDNDSVFKDLL